MKDWKAAVRTWEFPSPSGDYFFKLSGLPCVLAIAWGFGFPSPSGDYFF